MQLIKHATKDKLRGGFYTPDPIADFLLRWGVSKKDMDILEPSCGDGVFIERLKERGATFKSLKAIELDSIEAEKAKLIGLNKTEVINQDFHEYCNTTTDRFDLVIGNPPYIRYQYFEPEQQKQAAEIYRRANLKYTKLSNAWVSFVVGSSLLLKEEGKIGFVIPAELLQVSYAKPLRKFLSQFFNSIYIISFQKLVFSGIQQEVVLLMCEKNKSNTHHINHIELTDASELEKLNLEQLKQSTKDIDLRANKWTYYFLEQDEISLLNKVAEKYGIKKIGDYADVEVGITTGANNFFTVPRSIVESYELETFAEKMVGRSVQVSGAVFNKKDWKENILKGAKAYLLNFPPNGKLSKEEGALKYIKYGEKQGIHKGYKCRIRDNWYVVPSLWIPDGLFIRRNNVFPKLIVNDAQAYTTDTMHRVRLKNGYDIKALSASFYNSLSFAFAEISGRSYGGGVLELMPNEAESILLPYQENNKELLSYIDQELKKGTDIEAILKVTNEKILIDGYGFTKKDIALAHRIWKKLSKRRLTRGKKGK